jgi:hypothetical protein
VLVGQTLECRRYRRSYKVWWRKIWLAVNLYLVFQIQQVVYPIAWFVRQHGKPSGLVSGAGGSRRRMVLALVSGLCWPLRYVDLGHDVIWTAISTDVNVFLLRDLDPLSVRKLKSSVWRAESLSNITQVSWHVEVRGRSSFVTSPRSGADGW